MSAGGYPDPGEDLGPYRVVRRIGVGGMGVVFEAREESLGRQVALKVISPHLADDPDFRARFTREAQAQASLDSPHVVHVYGYGEAGGRLYLASQLIADGDLATMLTANGPLPLGMSLEVIAQVASGLADAHAAGLVHRDIKPANVLLRRRESGLTAYLADFGIARPLGSDTTTRTNTIGTPSYMAPELHTGTAPSVASDVYSLGCLLWTTLTGTPPYAGGSDYQVVSAHLHDPIPQLPPGSPAVPAVNAVLRRAMAKDPAQRYADATSMRQDLLAARRQPTGPVPAVDPAASLGRRRWRLVAMAAVALVVLGFGAVWLWIAIARPGGDDGAGSQVSPTPSASSTPSSTPTSPTSRPTASSSSSPGAGGGDFAKASDSFAAALPDQLGITPQQASCVADTFLGDYGVERAVADGLFDQDLNFLPESRLDDLPEAKVLLGTSTASCLGLGAGG